MAAPRKQISTRRRFEILKRDGFRCRYLACPTCDPGGYDIALTEWADPAERLDWRRHLVETKTGGRELIALIEDALCR